MQDLKGWGHNRVCILMAAPGLVAYQLVWPLEVGVDLLILLLCEPTEESPL